MDHYADDLAAVTAHLDLRDAVHVGHSTGGGEVVRYIARHGQGRVAKAVLISAVPPLMVQTSGGTPVRRLLDAHSALTSRPREATSMRAPEDDRGRPAELVCACRRNCNPDPVR